MNDRLADCLFLFDIDGTILSTEGDGKKAFIGACEKLLDRDIGLEIDFRGGIDYMVLRSVFQTHKGADFKIPGIVGEFKEHYLMGLKDLSEQNKDWILFKHAREIVGFLHHVSNIALVTGNFREGARIKLEHFDLSGFFQTGGFGDSAETRGRMVQDAIKECTRVFKKTFSPENIFLIGDTQKDIDSALENSIIPIFIDHYKKYDQYKKNTSIVYVEDFYTLIEKIKSDTLSAGF